MLQLVRTGTGFSDLCYHRRTAGVQPEVRSQFLCCFIGRQTKQPCHKVNHISLGTAAEAIKQPSDRVSNVCIRSSSF